MHKSNCSVDFNTATDTVFKLWWIDFYDMLAVELVWLYNCYIRFFIFGKFPNSKFQFFLPQNFSLKIEFSKTTEHMSNEDFQKFQVNFLTCARPWQHVGAMRWILLLSIACALGMILELMDIRHVVRGACQQIFVSNYVTKKAVLMVPPHSFLRNLEQVRGEMTGIAIKAPLSRCCLLGFKGMLTTGSICNHIVKVSVPTGTQNWFSKIT